MTEIEQHIQTLNVMQAQYSHIRRRDRAAEGETGRGHAEARWEVANPSECGGNAMHVVCVAHGMTLCRQCRMRILDTAHIAEPR